MKSPVGVCIAEFHWAGPDEIIETTTLVKQGSAFNGVNISLGRDLTPDK